MHKLRVLICPDSYKGSLAASDAAEAMAVGVRQACSDASIHLLPLADGGEGTATALVNATGGRFVAQTVSGPAGRPVEAAYGVLGDGETAVIEVAAAAGLLLLAPDERDPRRTTSQGVGELMSAALTAGYRRLILCLGGSGTNDGGLGLITGLGGRALTASGQPVGAGGAALADAAAVDFTGLHPALATAQILIASDVDNPLLGPTGASAVYGPQKGATPTMVAELDTALGRWADVLGSALGRTVAHLPGAGAAGGMAVPLLALGVATLRPGFDLVAQYTGLADQVALANLILTGEGRIDGQTLHGKVVQGVATLAKSAGVPCIAIGGTIEPGATALLDIGVTALFSLPQGPASLSELMTGASPLLTYVAAQVTRLYAAGRACRSSA